ncbi:MAG: AmmeMemoRadiSam system protein A [Candidatus Pacebacteria bacterium]|nr:AmmeMemoRadiSam system protein A [Candidatus Paceibacterota bacterium]
MNEYVKLARLAIETYIKTGEKIEVPKNLPEEFFNCQKGVFVTIYKKNDTGSEKQLRGCIGTFAPIKENIAQEIIDNAISSATNDYRFNPVIEKDLNNLSYEVSLLNPPEQIDSTKDLDAKKYGVIVKSQDGKTGLLLPDIEGVRSPEHQIEIACQKAGINLDEKKIELFRFTVSKYNLAS